MTNTADLLREILARDYKLDPAVLVLDTPLEGLGIDSLGVAELLFTVEDEFKIKMSTEPVRLSTFGEVVDYVDKLITAQRGDDAQAGVAMESA